MGEVMGAPRVLWAIKSVNVKIGKFQTLSKIFQDFLVYIDN
jgi:hypothetical protein